MNLHAIVPTRYGYNVASMARNLHAIEQTQSLNVASMAWDACNLISTQVARAEGALFV